MATRTHDYVPCTYDVGTGTLGLLRPGEEEEAAGEKLVLLLPVCGCYLVGRTGIRAGSTRDPGFWVVTQTGALFGTDYTWASGEMRHLDGTRYAIRPATTPTQVSLAMFHLLLGDKKFRYPLERLVFLVLPLPATQTFFVGLAVVANPQAAYVPVTTTWVGQEEIVRIADEAFVQRFSELDSAATLWLAHARPGGEGTTPIPIPQLAPGQYLAGVGEFQAVEAVDSMVDFGYWEAPAQPADRDLLASLRSQFQVLTEAEFQARFVPERELGKGGTGRITLCRDLHLGRWVAVKEALEVAQSGELVREASIWAYVELYRAGLGAQEPALRVPTYRGLYEVGGTFRMVQDYVPGTTVGEVQPPGLLPMVQILYDVFHTILLLDSLGVYHGDLNEGNVIVDPPGDHATVIDLGLGCIFGQRPFPWHEALAPYFAADDKPLVHECPASFTYVYDHQGDAMRWIIAVLTKQGPIARSLHAIYDSAALVAHDPDCAFILFTLLGVYATYLLRRDEGIPVEVVAVEVAQARLEQHQLLRVAVAACDLGILPGNQAILRPRSYLGATRLLQYVLWHHEAQKRAPHLVARWLCPPRHLISLVEGKQLTSAWLELSVPPRTQWPRSKALLIESLRQAAHEFRQVLQVELGHFPAECVLWDESHVRLVYLPDFYLLQDDPITPGLQVCGTEASRQATQNSIARISQELA